MSKIKKTPMLLTWDECETAEAEVKYRMEEDNPDNLSKEEIWNKVEEDTDFWRIEWDDLIEELTEILQKRNPDGHWFAKMEHFGWTNRNGHKYFYADNGKDFLYKILLETDCTFHIFNDGHGLKIQNFHHDSPMGNEWYYIRAVGGKEWEENNY